MASGLPDFFLNVRALLVLAGALAHGADALKPAAPDDGDVYMADDTEKVYFCFVDGVWTDVTAVGIATHAALTATHGVAGTIAGLADIAAHAALTTGVHGAGTNHVALFPAASTVVSRVVWKNASTFALIDTARVVTLDWTDLDLTAATSAAAKFAIVLFEINADVIGTGNYSRVGIRKNGTNPASPILAVMDKAGVTVGVYHRVFAIVALDAGQVLEYTIEIGTGWTLTSYIDILGYIE